MPDNSATFREIADGWTVTAVSGPIPEGFPSGPILAAVPGVIHTDLLRAELIDDPFDGDNEAAQQWIGDTVWRYETTFEWSDDGSARHDLVALGLDTVAVIELNGKPVSRTANQHRSYRWDVREHLVPGANTLTVTFAAPVPEAIARADRHGALPHTNHHEYNQLRKTASHFGWDWGIDVAGCGIWRPIGIDSWSGVRIAAVRPLVDVRGGTGLLTAHVELEWDQATEAASSAVQIVLSDPDGSTAAAATTQIPAGQQEATAEIEVPRARLWNPIGHGEHPLYRLAISIGDARWRSRLGFRTVRVDTAPDADGIPFNLYVNDELVLVRGVNWIPDHAFLTEIDRERYARRLQDAVDGNVNFVRVWGGGIYESDDFYELADELGLLVWQDFLFACAAYSEEEHLRAEVEAEAREQITRLSGHPSLAIWNGNNENIWGWADWSWRPAVGERSWGKGYYEQLLPALLAELDPSRFYSPASPFSFGDYLHPNDPRNGTMHIWDVWNQKDYTVYREYKPRFVSEFGFQGPPAWSTLTRVVHDEPLDPYGHEMLVHQKANLGNKKLERGYLPHLPVPETIDAWHWATQLNQAHAVRFGVEHFRSLTPLNTGTVLWQLNDNWPVVSWAAVDFDGHRKPLWYAMRAAYAPRLATIQPRPSARAQAEAFEGTAPVNDVLSLVVVNDTSEPLHEVPFTAERTDFDGRVLVSATILVSVQPRSAGTIELPEDIRSVGSTGTEVIVVRPANPESLEGAPIAPAYWNPADTVDQRLAARSLKAMATKTETGYQVDVVASSYTRDIFLQVDRVDPAATVDHGLVTLSAGQSATFEITSSAEVAPEDFLAPAVLRSANQLLDPTGIASKAGS
jgi:beta-mannosidase